MQQRAWIFRACLVADWNEKLSGVICSRLYLSAVQYSVSVWLRHRITSPTSALLQKKEHPGDISPKHHHHLSTLHRRRHRPYISSASPISISPLTSPALDKTGTALPCFQACPLQRLGYTYSAWTYSYILTSTHPPSTLVKGRPVTITPTVWK